MYAIATCFSDTFEYLCMLHCVIVNGGWGSWTRWSSCDATCGGGQRTRRRYCDNPAPSGGGSDCSGSNRQQENCNTAKCPGEISEDLTQH